MDEQEAEARIKEICRQLEENGGNAQKVLYSLYNSFKNKTPPDF